MQTETCRRRQDSWGREGGLLSCGYPHVVNNYVRRFVRLLLVTGTCRCRTLAWGHPDTTIRSVYRLPYNYAGGTPLPENADPGPGIRAASCAMASDPFTFIPAFLNVPVPTCVPAASGSMPEGGPAKTVGPETAASWPPTCSLYVPASINVPVLTRVPVGSGPVPEGAPAKTVA